MNSSVCSPSWVTTLSALLTPTIGIAVAYIAWRQWRTAHDKLKLDLFDRRIAIHGAVKNLLSSLMTHGKVGDDQLAHFLKGTRQARWLLNSEMVQYFDKEIWTKACHLQELEAILDGLPQGDERSSNVRKQREIRDWLVNQMGIVDEKFDRFLRFPI